jgi:hypothetical protein
MTEIRIPFMARFKEDMASGKKMATCRTRRYGIIGDTFTSYGMRFHLTHVEAMPLFEVRDKWWQAEGMSSPQEFEEVWNHIHPGMDFFGSAGRKVWLHLFARMDQPAQQFEITNTLVKETKE